MFNLDFIRRSSLMGTFAQQKLHFQQMIMHAWHYQHDVDVHLLFCFDLYLLQRSCLTFFVDAHWWVPLYVQRPAKAIPFQQIIMHALHYQHDVDVHPYFVLILTFI